MMSWGYMFFVCPSCLFMEYLIFFHDYIMIFLISISIMVFFSMFSTLILKDFNLSLTESHKLETVWTIVPMFILLSIVVPSLKLLYFGESCFFCGLTIYILGHQWYWSYNFSDFFMKDLLFDSYMIPSDSSMIRLLEVDNCLILPLNTPIRFMCSSSDVIHSWALPSLGIKMDAMPGRMSQFCLSLNRVGIFFGQCSEICGVNHSFMPIVLESVSMKDYVKMILACNLN